MSSVLLAAALIFFFPLMVSDQHTPETQRAQALVQHHDGVTGTSKQHVAEDYAQRLDRAWVGVEGVVSSALGTLVFGRGGADDCPDGFPQLRQCRLANVSVCDVTMEVKYVVVVVDDDFCCALSDFWQPYL